MPIRARAVAGCLFVSSNAIAQEPERLAPASNLLAAARIVARADTFTQLTYRDTALLNRATKIVVVARVSDAVPHSHPVLTLNTQYIANDSAQLSTLVHEQLHWYVNSKPVALDSALADLRRLYPTVPANPEEGDARDTQSTYLHLIVCQLEYDSVSRILGEAAARRVISGWTHYAWVYRDVLERPEPLRRILRRRGLTTPGSP